MYFVGSRRLAGHQNASRCGQTVICKLRSGQTWREDSSLDIQVRTARGWSLGKSYGKHESRWQKSSGVQMCSSVSANVPCLSDGNRKLFRLIRYIFLYLIRNHIPFHLPRQLWSDERRLGYPISDTFLLISPFHTTSEYSVFYSGRTEKFLLETCL